MQLILPETSMKGSALKKFAKEYAILLFFIAISLFFVFASGNFLKPENIVNILKQSAITGAMATVVTLIVISGGLDLSIGSTMTFCTYVIGIMAAGQVPLPVMLITVLVIGALWGVLNGTIISLVDADMTTMFMITFGVAEGIHATTYILSGGLQSAFTPTAAFSYVGKESVFNIPVLFILFALLIVIFQFILKRTKFGREVTLVGGNKVNAELSGINVSKIRVILFTVSGAMAGLAAFMYASRVSSAQLTAGNGEDMNVLAAIVIGGTSLAGGKGSLWRTLIGVFIMTVIANGMDMLGVDSSWQKAVKGMIILFAIMSEIVSKRSERA